MPRKKDPTAALAQSMGAAPAAPETTTAPAKTAKPKNAEKTNKTGVSDVADKPEKSAPVEAGPGVLPPGQAAVVASLVAQGFSYDEAVAMLSGGPRPSPTQAPAQPDAISPEEKARIKRLADGDDSDLPPVEDVPDNTAVVDVDLEKREGFKTLLDDLWTRREEIADVPRKTVYRLTVDIPAPEFDWLLHRTISEGQARRDAEYSVTAALVLLLKQQKALDPTRGGKRGFGASGPKDSFQPQAGGWTK